MIGKPFPKADMEHIGWFLEFYIDNKYMGTVVIDQPDRDQVGYYSRQDDVAVADILLDNGKKIKEGTRYYTRLYPLNGKSNLYKNIVCNQLKDED